MFGVFCIIVLAFSRTATSEIENDAAILQRLDATENLVRELLHEVDYLKSEDKLQKNQLALMETQLRAQQHRSSRIESLRRKLAASCRKEWSYKTEMSPVLTPKKRQFYTDKVSAINRKRRQEEISAVAFFAKMDNHLEHAAIHQSFIFDSVVTNVGNAYNNQLGSFVAPVPGIYVFSTTIVSRYFTNAHAQFVKNEVALTTMVVSGGSNGDDTSSQTIVLQLQKGDNVTVQSLDSDKSFYGSNHSSFAGFLLHEDY